MAWLIVLWIIFFIILGLWGFFSFIFISKKKLKKIDYATKNKFNYLRNNPVGSNLKSIETLVSMNQSLTPILDYLKSSNVHYLDKIDKLKLQIQNNSKLLKGFQLFSMMKRLNQVKANIELLEEEQINFKQFAFNTEEYTNYATKISIDLFDLMSKLDGFFKESHLNFTYDDFPEYIEIKKEIDNNNSKINEQLYYINDTQIHRLFLKQILSLKKMIDLLYVMFDTETYLVALGSIKTLIEEMCKENAIKPKYQQSIQKIFYDLEKFQADITKIINGPRKFDFKKLNKTIIDKIVMLEKVRRELYINNTYDNMYAKYIQPFQESINFFYEVIDRNNIKKIYKNILQNFNADQEVISLTKTNIEIANKTIMAIEKFNKENNRENRNTIMLAKLMFDICELFLDFKNKNEFLYKKTTKKYGSFMKISFKLSDLEMKLIQLKNFAKKISNVKTGAEIFKRIDEYRLKIDTLSKRVLSNFDEKDQSVMNELNEIENFIESTMQVIQTDWILFQVCERLKMYANRYHSSQNRNELKNIEGMVKKNELERAANHYIEFINKNKKMKRAS